MKKKFYLLALFVILLAISGCSDNVTENQQLIDKVVELEEAERKFLDLEISYDEFYSTVEKIMVDPHYYDEEIIIALSNEQYRGKDFAGLSIEEINALVDELEDKYSDEYEKIFSQAKNTKMVSTFKVSDVYDYPDHNWKYIYSQTIINITYPDESVEGYMNKRYRFENIDGEWKIKIVESAYTYFHEGNPEKLEMKEELLADLHYQTNNNEPVEYVRTIKNFPFSGE